MKMTEYLGNGGVTIDHGTRPHRLDHPVSSVQYSSLCTIQLAKNGQFNLVPAN